MPSDPGRRQDRRGEQGRTSQGDSQFALARSNTDGSLDQSFHGDGKVTLDLTAEASDVANAAIQADRQGGIRAFPRERV
jgi:hypothetical protein